MQGILQEFILVTENFSEINTAHDMRLSMISEQGVY